MTLCGNPTVIVVEVLPEVLVPRKLEVSTPLRRDCNRSARSSRRAARAAPHINGTTAGETGPSPDDSCLSVRNHVAIQVLGGGDELMSTLEELAGPLGLRQS